MCVYASCHNFIISLQCMASVYIGRSNCSNPWYWWGECTPAFIAIKQKSIWFYTSFPILRWGYRTIKPVCISWTRIRTLHTGRCTHSYLSQRSRVKLASAARRGIMHAKFAPLSTCYNHWNSVCNTHSWQYKLAVQHSCGSHVVEFFGGLPL